MSLIKYHINTEIAEVREIKATTRVGEQAIPLRNLYSLNRAASIGMWVFQQSSIKG